MSKALVVYDTITLQDELSGRLLNIDTSEILFSEVSLVNSGKKKIELVFNLDKKFEVSSFLSLFNIIKWLESNGKNTTYLDILDCSKYNGFDYNLTKNKEVKINNYKDSLIVLSNKDNKEFKEMIDKRLLFKLLFAYDNERIKFENNILTISEDIHETDFKSKISMIKSILYDNNEILNCLEEVKIFYPFKFDVGFEEFKLYNGSSDSYRLSELAIESDCTIVLKNRINLETNSINGASVMLSPMDLKILGLVGNKKVFFYSILDYEVSFLKQLISSYLLKEMTDSERIVATLNKDREYNLDIEEQTPYKSLLDAIRFNNEDIGIEWGVKDNQTNVNGLVIDKFNSNNTYRLEVFQEKQYLPVKEVLDKLDSDVENTFKDVFEDIDFGEYNIKTGDNLFLIRSRNLDLNLEKDINKIFSKAESDKQNLKKEFESFVSSGDFKKLLVSSSVFDVPGKIEYMLDFEITVGIGLMSENELFLELYRILTDFKSSNLYGSLVKCITMLKYPIEVAEMSQELKDFLNVLILTSWIEKYCDSIRSDDLIKTNLVDFIRKDEIIPGEVVKEIKNVFFGSIREKYNLNVKVIENE